jgi:hypothetical protein
LLALVQLELSLSGELSTLGSGLFLLLLLLQLGSGSSRVVVQELLNCSLRLCSKNKSRKIEKGELQLKHSTQKKHFQNQQPSRDFNAA